MKKYLVKHYIVSLAKQDPEQFIPEIYAKYLAPLSSYISKPTTFLQIITHYKNVLGGEFILTEMVHLNNEQVEFREATLESPLHEENANSRNSFPRIEFRREVPVDGNIERLMTANQFYPEQELIRKGQFFQKKLNRLYIFREFWPAMVKVDDKVVYTGSEHPANAPMKQYGHERFLEDVFGRFDKQLFGSVHSDFESNDELQIIIEAQGQNDQENEVALLEMERVVGEIETEN